MDFIKMRGFALRSCLCLFLLLFLSKLNVDIIKHYTDKLATDKYIHTIIRNIKLNQKLLASIAFMNVDNVSESRIFAGI